MAGIAYAIAAVTTKSLTSDERTFVADDGWRGL